MGGGGVKREVPSVGAQSLGGYRDGLAGREGVGGSVSLLCVIARFWQGAYVLFHWKAFKNAEKDRQFQEG